MDDSDCDEENTILFGTPLEPIEEDDIPSKRKYQEAPDQYAVDEHGRRRFHGAFTGGFSAGYGNTVGTPEGWKPATFKSSRSDKAQTSTQRPEDFMDDEDRSEFGIAPRQVQTHSDFTGQKRKIQRYHDGPIPGEPVLEQFLRTVHETAAVKMLKAMGWKPGQGTGDRVSKNEKKRAKEQHKVYGCYIPPEMKQNTENRSDSDSSESDLEFDTLLAPDDYEPYILQRKNDRFGLGYSGLSRHSVLGNLTSQYGENSSKSHLLMKEKGKKVSIRGQAFGVGAFEADDEDIYANEDMSHYDFAIGGSGEDKQKKKGAKGKTVNVLEGFVKASKPLPVGSQCPPPALPRGYTPASASRSRFEATTAPQRDQGLGRHELTAEARGALLGEKPVPKLPDPIPIPDTPPKEDSIAKLIGRNVAFVSTEGSGGNDFISIKDSGKEVPKTFRPFMSTPDKQMRYERYLKDKEGFLKDGNGDLDALSEWERNRELAEFEQAAKLYKPLSGIIGDRFTHASEPDDALNPLSAVTRTSNSYGLATTEQVEAAKKGVYGVMTRTQQPWKPDSLVCKRFNIPDPGGVGPTKKVEDKPKVSYSIFSYLESSVHDKDSFAKEQSMFSGSKSLNLPKPNHSNNENIPKTVKENTANPLPSTSSQNTGNIVSKRMTVAELFLKESENNIENKVEVNDTIEKFDKMDLYKAIFLSDSENEEVTTVPTKSPEVNANDFIDKPKNIERNLSPPRGIFANIDFDELNSWKRKPDEKASDTAKNSKVIDDKTDSKDVGQEVYGPKIPDNLLKRQDTVPEESFKPVFRRKTEKETVHVIDASSSEDSWVDAKEVKSKKHKKKKKKHKSKKSKHKKKDK